ncbi:MAG: hypothetical protein GEV06_15960 [Luteitalea sp.]|nr:hypothetical protein [Luteitalea sp.]
MTGQGFGVATDECSADTSGATQRRMYIAGGPGDDTLIGGLATDTLYGGLGNDTLNGCDGVDTARYDNADPEPDGVTGVIVDLVAGTATAAATATIPWKTSSTP